MGLAVAFHVNRREVPQIAFSGTFCIVAAFVAIGRFVIAPVLRLGRTAPPTRDPDALLARYWRATGLIA